jgi:hypothetical protein
VSTNETREPSVAEARVVTADLRLRAERAEEGLRRLQERETSRALVLETANQVALDILSRRSGVEALRHIVEARGCSLGRGMPLSGSPGRMEKACRSSSRSA